MCYSLLSVLFFKFAVLLNPQKSSLLWMPSVYSIGFGFKFFHSIVLYSLGQCLNSVHLYTYTQSAYSATTQTCMYEAGVAETEPCAGRPPAVG